MCIESSIAIARILHIYEKHYTFRRMNNQVVSMIFSAALILLYVTISTTPLSSRTGLELTDSSTEMVAYLNLCFRALDDLGQSFENAKRTRDFLVSLQRRWQARMRRSGAMKRQMSGHRPPQVQSTAKDTAGSMRDPSATRKKTRLTPPSHNRPHGHAQTASSFPISTSPPHTFSPPDHNLNLNPSQGQPQHGGGDESLPISPNTNPLTHAQQNDIDSWIRDSELGLLPDNITNPTGSTGVHVPGMPGISRVVGTDSGTGNAEIDDVDVGLPSLADIDPWWDSSEGAGNVNSNAAAFGSSL
jgi:hypothetical protein